MQEKIGEVIKHYFNKTDYYIEPVPFGLTNITNIVTIDNQKYIVRIYNRYTKNVESIQFEAQITSYLNENAFSFKVPDFLNTFTGEPYVQLSDGSLCSIISFIEGSTPAISNIQQAVEFGSIVGEVSCLLSKFGTSLSFKGIPFTDIYGLHPLANYDEITAFIKNPPFEIPLNFLEFYKKKVTIVEKSIHTLFDMQRQLVHHDLLIYNLLSTENIIQGVLDFDFTSLDVGFMEFTISLNHIL